jgi:preprotein translocase SecF subunit
MFAALVITRVLVHFALERGVERFGMARWMADAKFSFMRHGKLAAVASTIAILTGVGLFISEPNAKKLGIDFLGGASLKVRTQQAMTPAELRGLVAALPGDLAQADVAALPGSRVGDGTYEEFRITFKTSGESVEADSEGLERIFETEVRQALADVLQRGPIEASVDAETNRATVVLYFEQPHSVEDVRAALAPIPLQEPEVSLREGQDDVFLVSAGVAAGTDAGVLQALVSPLFVGAVDGAGRDFSLANPVAETNVIGAQVVGELRDSAIQALLLSILLTVIYIRVRFAEYSYGWAAVAAVVHDILTTLGAVAVLIVVPFIQVEMNLTLIAAFLTIFGYSLNDTIIIFDRIRENLPRVKGTFAEIVDLSINQTLSRTIVTSGTTLLATLIILAFNFGTGNALEGFGFALSFGILTGTYSTIFIACPLLVRLEERNRRKLEAERSSARRSGGKAAEATSSAS